MNSTDTRTWLVTGAGRGMGVDFARAAVAAGHNVVATGRNPDSDEPPLRWVAGEDAVEGVEQKARLLLAQVDAHRELSTNLAHDDARVAA
jgi:NAD(P)-dependent dehydrogenase (short-subunit alcohol dehydrogenase family)